MGKRIEAIKRMQQSSPTQLLAGYLNYYVLNGKDHFWKTKHYNYAAFFELNHDNEMYMIDVYYLGQETSFPLSTFMRKAPDYKSVLAITPQLLEWLENTYTAYGAPDPVVPSKPTGQRKRRARVPQGPRQGPLSGNVLNQSNGGRQ